MKKADGDRRPNSFHAWWMRYYTYIINAEKVKCFLPQIESDLFPEAQSSPLRTAKNLLPDVVDASISRHNGGIADVKASGESSFQ
jgi:hypothetical protein